MLRCQKRLNDIAALLADSRMTDAAQAHVAAVQQALSPLRAKSRNLELELQSTTQKLQATEAQLYSGKVKNPKEMQDMEQEIAALKRRRGQLEETLLEAMMAVEDQESELRTADATLQRLSAERQDANRDLTREQAQLQTQLAALRAERDAVAAGISAENLAKYNALRPRKNNQPVALLEAGSCSVCGVEQTLAITREAQLSQSLVTCLSCGRILVYKH